MNKKQFRTLAIERMMEKILKTPIGTWITFTPEDCCFGTYDGREEIFNEVRNMFKLMRVHYAIPPQHPTGSLRYEDTVRFKIKLRDPDAKPAETIQRKNIYDVTHF